MDINDERDYDEEAANRRILETGDGDHMSEKDRILTAVRRFLDWNKTFFPENEKDWAEEYDANYILGMTLMYRQVVDDQTDYRIRLDLNDELHYVDLLFTFEDDRLKRLGVYADTDYQSCFESADGN